MFTQKRDFELQELKYHHIYILADDATEEFTKILVEADIRFDLLLHLENSEQTLLGRVIHVT